MTNRNYFNATLVPKGFKLLFSHYETRNYINNKSRICLNEKANNIFFDLVQKTMTNESSENLIVRLFLSGNDSKTGNLLALFEEYKLGINNIKFVTYFNIDSTNIKSLRQSDNIIIEYLEPNVEEEYKQEFKMKHFI